MPTKGEEQGLGTYLIVGLQPYIHTRLHVAIPEARGSKQVKEGNALVFGRRSVRAQDF